MQELTPVETLRGVKYYGAQTPRGVGVPRACVCLGVGGSFWRIYGAPVTLALVFLAF